MTIEELKQIQLYRQHLTAPADKLTVVKDLCGIQCQFMTNAYHSLHIRCSEILDPVLWGKGLVKNWTLRGTVHVFAEEDLPLFKFDDGFYHNNEWHGETDRGMPWISAERERFFADYLIERVSAGTDTREALREDCRAAGMTPVEESFIFDGWGGLLRPLCERGFLTYKVQEKKAFALAPEYTPLSEDVARQEQMRRYLTHIAPATLRDIAYFFGYTQTRVKQILSKLPVETLCISGTDYFYIGELEGDYPSIPNCVLLAGFDQLMLGYEKKDSRYLPQDYLRGIFNLAGIVMPAVLLDGTVAGRWKRKNKKVEIMCFRPFTSNEKHAVEQQIFILFGEDITAITYLL